jgi:hypothetical protein
MYCRSVFTRLLVIMLTACAATAFGQDVVHAVAGAVTRVDAAGKTIAVKTADGTEEVFKYTAKTAVSTGKGMAAGMKKSGVESYLAGKEGTHVVVRYVEKGGDKTALAIKDFGKDGLKFGKGTVTHVDKVAHTVAIKTEDGAEATYHFSKDATIDTEHGLIKGTKYTAKEGDKVLFHYTEEAGDKIVHYLKG